MTKAQRPPETLLTAIRYFADPDVCLSYLTSLRWPDGAAVCPRCDSAENYFISTRRIWKCRGCKKQFSIKVGTIFEDSPIGLDKWLPCLWMVVNCKNGISSYEVARSIGVTQKTGWFMLHRIRLAMQTASFTKMEGEVEADETYIGGKARNKGHRLARRKKALLNPGEKRRRRMAMTAVMGLLERGPDGTSRVRTRVVRDVRRASIGPEIHESVAKGSTIYTDALQSYVGLDSEYVHQVINHAEAYANGRVHVNGLENFWSLLKRALRGTYVNVEPFHLFRYLDEQTWRYNKRKGTDAMRFVMTLHQIIGRRLTYKALIGAGSARTA